MGDKSDFLKTKDFIFHLDDDVIELSLIKSYTKVTPVSIFGNPNWKTECDNAVEKYEKLKDVDVYAESNIKIAKFLGYKEHVRKVDVGDEFNPKMEDEFCWLTPDGKRPNSLNFHWDWNSLMKVVDKIESIYDKHHGYFGVYISSNSCTIQGTKLHLSIKHGSNYGYVYYSQSVMSTKIESVYHEVLLFIDWYTSDYLEENYGEQNEF